MSCSTTSDWDQQLEVYLVEIHQKLDALIHQDQVNQLLRAGVESNVHSIWSKVCYQRACVPTSSQTDELVAEDRRASLEPPVDFNETRRALQEEENEFNAEGNAAKNSRVCPDQQNEPVPLNETEEETELNGEAQQAAVQVRPSSSPSARENELPGPDASPEQATRRSNRSKLSREGNSTGHRRTSPRPNEDGSFDCAQCGKAYSTRDKLLRHSRHVHGKSHKRTVCGRTLSSPSCLNIHTSTHTGATPFGCGFCRKSYASQGSLRRHVRLHHAQ